MTQRVTYSPAYTIVPTYECFNRCTYCNFRVEGQAPLLTIEAADRIFARLQQQSQLVQAGQAANVPVCEILILSGEVHPQSERRSAWFQRIYDLCDRAIHWGFLPHTNAGPLLRSEMTALKQVNVSLGLMLEQVTPRLLQTVHRFSPSKQPETRLAQLELAGSLQIPFTTGLLLGLGETEQDWRDTLQAIARSHQTWGHIQEVILQPHSPGTRQQLTQPPFDPKTLPAVVALARELLPADITIQIPPNLITQPDCLLACLAAGARDLGGLSPIDEVNPDYDHPDPVTLGAWLSQHGWQLVPRLPVYPQYWDQQLPRLQTQIQYHHERQNLTQSQRSHPCQNLPQA